MLLVIYLLSENGADDSTYLLSLVGGLNEFVQVKHLGQFLACGKCPVVLDITVKLHFHIGFNLP